MDLYKVNVGSGVVGSLLSWRDCNRLGKLFKSLSVNVLVNVDDFNDNDFKFI